MGWAHIYGIHVSMCFLTISPPQMDWKDQHLANTQHHLQDIQMAMGLPKTYEFGDIVDVVFKSLLENLKAVHSCNIVHRDCE